MKDVRFTMDGYGRILLDIKGGFWDQVGPLSSVFANSATENKRNHEAKTVDAR